MIGKYLNPKNDFVFKRLFGQEKNKDLLITMLNLVLSNKFHQKIESVEFLPTIFDAEAKAKKQSIVDVLCQDQDGCRYIVEMQVAAQDGFQKRAQYYAAKAYTNQLSKGGKYEDLKEVIFLAFCDFDIFPEDHHYKSINSMMDHQDGKIKLRDFSFVFVNLPKFEAKRTQSPSALSLEEKFYYFLHHGEEMSSKEIKAFAQHDLFILKAAEEVDSSNWTEAEYNSYEAVLKNERDAVAIIDAAKKAGLKEGLEKGLKQGKVEGIKEGIEQGKVEGFKEGAKQGEIKMIRALIKEGVISKEKGEVRINQLLQK